MLGGGFIPILSMSEGMVTESNEDLLNRFIAFYRDCCPEEVEQLAQNYPDEQRSLYIDYADVKEFDPDIADDYLNQPDQMRPFAEEALSQIGNPADVSLSEARVRLHNLPDMPLDPGSIRSRDDIIGSLVTVRGYVLEASDVAPTITQAAFECQRCGTLTRIPQSSDDLQEPHECKGCERRGPFRVNHDQSEFENKQTLTVVPLPEVDPTADGELEVVLEDDLAGEVVQGDRVEIAGVVDIEREKMKTAVTIYLTGEAVSRISAQDTELYSGSYLAVPEDSINEEELEAFVKRSTAVLRTQTLDEFGTRGKIITPFLHLLGWNVYHPEVRFEYSDSEVDGGQADYALLDEDESPVFVVEAKQEGKDLDLHIGQLKTYLRVFQARYGLLTNGERYMFFCTNPASDGSSELVVLDCRLSDLEEHRDILAAYGRESIVGDRTSLEALAEVAQEIEADQRHSESRTLTPMEKKQLKAVKQIIDDLDAGEWQGAPIETVYQRTSSELDISEGETDKMLEGLQNRGEVYWISEDRIRGT